VRLTPWRSRRVAALQQALTRGEHPVASGRIARSTEWQPTPLAFLWGGPLMDTFVTIRFRLNNIWEPTEFGPDQPFETLEELVRHMIEVESVAVLTPKPVLHGSIT